MHKSAKPGLRERKRVQTREKIAETALSLFLKNGFDETTVDEIAAAANVSKRTFFDYFPAKEDVVQAWQDEFGTALAEALAARPAAEPIVAAVQNALKDALKAAFYPRNIAIDRLTYETPALQARNYLKYLRLERTLVEAIARRSGRKLPDRRMHLLAMLIVGSLRLGSSEQREESTRSAQKPLRDEFFLKWWRDLRAVVETADIA